MLVDTCVETLDVFEAMVLAVFVTLLVNVAVTSDIKGVAIVVGCIWVDFDGAKTGGKPR